MGDLFYRNPRLTALTVGLVLVAGLSALEALPRQEDPALARRFGVITTFYPGASAQRVESLVTEPIEDEVRELHEVKNVESLSRTGVSVISIELDDEYSESMVDDVWSKVRDKLGDAQAGLPDGVLPPEFEDKTSTAVTLLAALVWQRDDAAPPLGMMTRLAEELESRLRNIPNTKQTELFGEAEEEIRVTVDPLELAAVGLTADRVAQAIALADSKVPAGQLRHGASDLLLEVGGEIDSLGRVRAVPVHREADGSMLRVGDLADVQKTYREPASSIALIDGRRAVAVAATMETNTRVDLWSREARAVVDGYRAEVPAGLELRRVFDQSRYTEERLGTLVGNLLLGSSIVVCVLLLTMGVRSALIVASALPLTVAMVLAELNVLGIPLHQTSVTGLIIALGLLIDNSIVVVDEFDARRRKGASPGDAVAGAVGHLRVPLMASTLTTVLAFLPIVLMPGGAGEFVGPISIGVALSVTSSFLLSMTVIPALAGLLSPRHPRPAPDGRRHWWREGYSHPRLTRAYRRTLRVALGRPGVGIGVSLVLPVVGFIVGQTLSEQFFPANDRNQFQVQLVLPSQSSIAETEAAVRRAREIIHRHPEVVESQWVVGESAPRVFYNMFANNDGVASFAGGYVTTLSPEATEDLLPRLQPELIAAFPDARAIALPFEQGPPFEAPIEVRIVGPELDVLRSLGEQIRGLLAESESVTYTTSRQKGGEPKLLFETDEDEARLADLRLVDIAGQLNARLEGSVGGTLIEQSEELPVRVRVAGTWRADVAEIAAGRLLPPGAVGLVDAGGLPGVPVSAIARPTLVPEISGIDRRNGERVNTVQAFLSPYAVIADSLADFEGRLADSGFELPPGYRLELGGENEQRSEALSKLAAFALPLFVIMAGAIILSFNSFRMALVIFAVAILGIGMALFGVWLFGYPMGFVAIIGTMGLVGLAINDAIVVLNHLRTDPRAAEGDVDDTAEVVVDATRHILTTTLTTIGGFWPLIVFGGRFWPPMATAIAGGVAGCSIVALYMVPTIYRQLRLREARRARRSDGGGWAGEEAEVLGA
ncbi:MAG: efflux RND transporter permease subunit [Myxococcota bacterium]